ncbi:hypothetical protein SKAU_G00013270 [Synaphobranchus kaupii]|uniref:Uncharacterized protein n=1 Tax=Synaphobranchus kaupii TaxID=118154 RepID=A0A9Q1JDQ9_SYNKA|nr:hypothetical protein SKAU_G00013270 [Synaphobranchus kaupii]
MNQDLASPLWIVDSFGISVFDLSMPSGQKAISGPVVREGAKRSSQLLTGPLTPIIRADEPRFYSEFRSQDSLKSQRPQQTDSRLEPTPAPVPAEGKRRDDSSTVGREPVNDSLFLHDFNS